MTVLPNDGYRLAFESDHINKWTSFQAVDASLNTDKYSLAKTIVGFKSNANGRFISAGNGFTDNLVTNQDELNELESFIVYFGDNNSIALKLKNENQFITNDDKTSLYLADGFLNDQKIFKIVTIDKDLDLFLQSLNNRFYKQVVFI